MDAHDNSDTLKYYRYHDRDGDHIVDDLLAVPAAHRAHAKVVRLPRNDSPSKLIDRALNSNHAVGGVSGDIVNALHTLASAATKEVQSQAHVGTPGPRPGSGWQQYLRHTPPWVFIAFSAVVVLFVWSRIAGFIAKALLLVSLVALGGWAYFAWYKGDISEAKQLLDKPKAMVEQANDAAEQFKARIKSDNQALEKVDKQ